MENVKLLRLLRSMQGAVTYDIDLLKVSDLLSGHLPILNSEAFV